MPRTARTGALLLVASAWASATPAADLDLGGVTVVVSDSWTAQVFHIVDQLSLWAEGCHKGYARWANRTHLLDDEDRALLRKHAEIRRVRGWGGGFEQSFYVEASIDAAAESAVESKLLSREEANAEREILLHFARKLEPLRESNALAVAAFRKRLTQEADRIAPTIRKLVRFSETTETPRIPLFLISNPEEGSGGGGFNGGRLAVEVQRTPDPIPILIHECLHSLLWRHKAAIESAAATAGLSFGTLNEGIAYAFAPGIVDYDPNSDSVGEALVRNVLKGSPATDTYVQSYMLALVIRPVLRASLESGESFTVFLPKAVAKWRACRASARPAP